MKNAPPMGYVFTFLMCLTMFVNSAFAQLTSGDVTNSSLYHLQVSESSQTVPSNVDLEYDVNFVFPVRSTESNSHFDIVFNYDPRLTVVAYMEPGSYTSVSGGAVFNATYNNDPALGQVTMTISSTYGSTPGNVFGQFKVRTQMPSSAACNNDTLQAQATLHYFQSTPPGNGSLTTNTPPTIVRSVVQVNNPWRIRKGCTNATLRPGGTCSNYLLTGNVLNYRVDVELDRPWDITGTQDLNINSIIDQPSVAGIFTIIPNANLGQGAVLNSPANISITNGGQIMIPGGVLDATNLQHYHINFSLTIPALTPLGCVTNRAVLNATDPCNHPYNDTSTLSNVERVASIPQDLEIFKSVDMHGNLPGCTGTWIIRIRNPAGNGDLAYDLVDILPACIANVQIGPTTPVVGVPAMQPVPGGFRMFGVVPGNPLQVTEFIYRINFSIGPTCAGQVTNNVWHVDPASPPNPIGLPISASFVVLPDTTFPCLNKSICGVPGDSAGGVIRFRLRIQNFGQRPMTNWHLRDNLRAVGLDYIANSATYYRTNTRSRTDTGCGRPAGANDWNTVVSNWNSATGILDFTLTTPQNVCDTNSQYESQLNIGCNNGGTNLPAFYIEFSARILDTAAIGVAQNCATLTNDSTWNVISCVPFHINGLTTYSIDKAVNTGEGFAQSGTVQPGQLIQYRLHAQSSGAPVRTPFFIDLLPMNGGHIIPATLTKQDRFLTQPLDRGSTLDVFYVNQANGTFPIPNALLVDNRQDLNLKIDFGNSADFGMASPPTFWASVPPNNTKNIKVTYPTFSAGQDLTYIFNARIDSFGSGHACNTFGFDCYKKVWRNFQQSLELQLPLESAPVCVAIPADSGCCHNDTVLIPLTGCVNEPIQMCAVDTCAEGIVYNWNFGDGTTATDKCVVHTFSMTGSYRIIITWSVCGINHSVVRYINVTNCNLCCCRVDSFVVPQQVCTGYAAQFCAVDHCDHDISYTWNFGDGTTAVTTTNRCINHTYTRHGGYWGEVTWTDCDGDHRQTFGVEANDCTPCEIEPDFSFDAETSCPIVSFFATPVQNNVVYVWDFGDGTHGSGQAPSHYYAPGSYTVTLSIYTIDPANGDLCKCMVHRDHVINVPDCGQGFPPRSNGSLAKTAFPLSVSGGNELLTATPNPFNNSLTVKLTNAKEGKNGKEAVYTLSVLNSAGSTLSTKSIAPNSTIVMNTQNYAAGTYLLTLRSRDGTVKSRRIVKINQ